MDRLCVNPRMSRALFVSTKALGRALLAGDVGAAFLLALRAALPAPRAVFAVVMGDARSLLSSLSSAGLRSFCRAARLSSSCISRLGGEAVAPADATGLVTAVGTDDEGESGDTGTEDGTMDADVAEAGAVTGRVRSGVDSS